MNNEEKFKDHLKNKLESKEFEFDEVNWDKASKLIDENRKKKSPWPYFLMLGMFIGSLLTYFILNNEKPVISQTISPKQDILKTIAEPQSNSIPEKSAEQSEVHSKIKIATASPKSPVPQTKINNSKIVLSIPAAQTPETEMKTITKAKTSNVSPSEDKPSDQGSETSEVVVPVVSIPAQTIANEDPGNQIPTTQKAQTATPLVVTLLIPDENKVKNESEAIPSGNEIKTNTDEQEIITKEAEAVAVTALPSPTVAPEVLTPAADSNKVSESHTKAPLKSNLLSIEAGANYLFGWKNNGVKEAQGFNPVIGINYHNKLTNDFDYSLGIQFSSIGHLSAYSDTSKVTHYKYGEESDVTIITPQTLYYLSMPFRVSKTCNMNTIGLNANLAYLLTTNSKVETYHQSVDMTNQNTTTASGYTQGFANYNLALGAFYMRRLYKNLYIHTEFVFGLTDLKNNSFFQNSSIERSSGMKVTLLYGLITR